MRQLAIIALLVLPFWVPNSAFAQSEAESLFCYEKLLRDGNRFFQRQQFAKAAEQYRTALENCDFVPEDNRLDSLIRAAQRAEIAHLEEVRRRLREQIDRIQRLVQQEQEARQAAEAAQRLAESNAALARRNEEIAIRNGRRAASLRLSTLADLQREAGKISDAWQLSLLALRWSDSISYPSAMQAFTRIIADSFATRLEVPAGIRKMQLRTEVVDIFTGDSVQRISLFPGTRPPLQVVAQELVAGSDDGMLLRQQNQYVWLYKGLRQRFVIPDSKIIETAHFINTGTELLTTSTDNTLLHWLNGDAPVLQTSQIGDRIYDLVTIDTSERLFATRSSSGYNEIWKIGQPTPIRTLSTNDTYTYDILSKREVIIAGTATGELFLFPPKVTEPLVIQHSSFAIAELLDLAGSEELVLSQAIDGTVKIWNLSGELQAMIDPGAEILGLRDRPEKREIIVWTADRRISRWTYGGHQLGSISGFPSRILDVCVVPETDLLLVTGTGGELIFLEENSKVGELPVLASLHTIPDFSKTSRQIVCVSPAGDQLITMPLPQTLYAEHSVNFNFSVVPEKLVKKFSIEPWE